MRRDVLSSLSRRFVSTGHEDRFFFAALALALTSIWLIFGLLAYQSYSAQWDIARLSANNLAALLDHDIARNMEVYDGAMQGAVRQLTDPMVRSLPVETRRQIMSHQAWNISEAGSMFITDADGRVLPEAGIRRAIGMDLSDRSYFKIHRDGSYGDKLFISEPYQSKVHLGVTKISLSRRVSNLDGSFAGVVAMAMSLDYFQTLFAKVQLPKDSVVALSSRDGTFIARIPFSPEMIGKQKVDFARYGLVDHISGERVITSHFDGLRRLIIFREIAGLPLVQMIGLSTQGVYDEWFPSAVTLAAAFLVLSLLITTLAFVLRRELRNRAHAEDELTKLANTDALTGLANRRHFDDMFDLEWRRAIRSKSPLSLVIVDCDHFKAYNDSYGHVEGDKALALVAQAIKSSINRPADQAARIGGEEFVVLLPDTPSEGAAIVAQRIKARVGAARLPHCASPIGILSVSAGVGAHLPKPGETSDGLVRKADQALYTSKEKGRDTITIAADDATFPDLPQNLRPRRTRLPLHELEKSAST